MTILASENSLQREQATAAIHTARGDWTVLVAGEVVSEAIEYGLRAVSVISQPRRLPAWQEPLRLPQSFLHARIVRIA